jgi:fibronectin-binding autotransporter adhesin
MKPKRHLSLLSLKFSHSVAAISTLLLAVAPAAPLVWDADNLTSGAQDGAGTWSVGGTTFWNGASNVASANDLTTDTVTFGAGGTGAAVTANAQSINGLGFGTTVTSGYTLSGGILTLGSGGITSDSGALATSIGNAIVMGSSFGITNNSANLLTLSGTVTSAATGTQTLSVGGTGDTTISGLLNDGTSGTLNLTKTGAGYLRLTGAATNINGTVDLQGGTIGTSQDFTAGGLTGTGIFQNTGLSGTKWTFWNINSDQTFDGIIRNNNGTGTMQLGIVKRGTGTWTLTNNANNATANLSVDAGKLVLNNTGTFGVRADNGSTTTNFTATVGNTAAANGVLEINGATVNYNNRSAAGAEPWRSTLSIANNGTGAGAVVMTSGSLTTNKQLAIGSVNSAFGAYTQTGGTANIGGFLAIGLGNASGRGVFNLSGGTFNMQAGPVTNGAGAGSIGLMNISGTAEYNQQGTGDNGIWLGENGSGGLNLSGGAKVVFAATNNGLQLGRNATGSGVLNLLGGTVTTPAVTKGAGTGTINFNGGTLKATGNNAAFMTGLTSAYVRGSGSSIHNNGFAVTVGQALLAPTGNGVSATGLTVSGSGFIATPLVTVTGGGGSGATAVAIVDGSGNLTGISITNPGVGYTSAPTFSIVGGGIGSTSSITGAATLAANTSGGMEFSGSGTTILSGVSTYTGATLVSVGTLLVNGSLGNTAVSVSSGATLGGTSGTIGSGSASVNVASGGTLAPGSSPGTLVVNGNTTIDGIYSYEYDGGTSVADLLDVNGTLTLNSATLSLFDLSGDSYTLGDKFTLIAYDFLSGGFAGYTDDTEYTFGGGSWLFDYNDVTPGLNGGVGNNFITITAVPEPAAAFLGCFGLIALLRRRRR